METTDAGVLKSLEVFIEMYQEQLQAAQEQIKQEQAEQQHGEPSSKKRKADDDSAEQSTRPAPANRLNPATPNPRKPAKKRVIDRNMAADHLEQFLEDAFFDENGEDAGYGPVVLKGLDRGERHELHKAATVIGLFYLTAGGERMVIGSRKNRLGQKKFLKLDRYEYVSSDDDDENEDTDGDDTSQDDGDDDELY